MPGHSQTVRNITESKIRIIAGQWRGRKLTVGNENGLRPTSDRLRETLFNWLMADIPGAKVLDLFAGTGALGIEALSRGAHSAKFLETNGTTASRLRDNLRLLHADPSSVVEIDSLQWLQQHPIDELSPTTQSKSSLDQAYDIVFIDPPFDLNLWGNCIENLLKSSLIDNGSLIYIEKPRAVDVNIPSSLQHLKSKNLGAIQASLYQKQHSSYSCIPD